MQFMQRKRKVKERILTKCIPKYANSILPRIVPSTCCSKFITAGTYRSSVSVFDNVSSCNTLHKNIAVASSSSAEAKLPDRVKYTSLKNMYERVLFGTAAGL